MKRISVWGVGCLLLVTSTAAHAMGRKLDLHQIEGTYALVAGQSDSHCPRENTVRYDPAKAEVDSESFTFSRIGKAGRIVGSATAPDGSPARITEKTSLSKDALTRVLETSETNPDGQRIVTDTLKVSIQYRDGLLVRYATVNGTMTPRGLCTYVKEPLNGLTPEAQAGIAETSDQDGPSQQGPDWLYKPGFHAIIGSVQDQSFIFIESRADGLVFRYCEQGDGLPNEVISGKALPTECPTVLNNDGIAIPPNVLLEQSLGIKRILLTAMRVAASGAVIGLTNISWGYLTSAAAMVNSVLPPDPIGDIKDYVGAKDVINQMLKYGNLSEKKQDGYIVTELLDQPYDNIKSGVLSELTGILKGMDKHDKTLALRRDLAYHTLMNLRYAALRNGQSPAAPAPAAATQGLN